MRHSRLTNTGKVLRDLQEEYLISGKNISANGGPDPTTLSRIRRGRNMPTTAVGRERCAEKIAHGFYAAVKLSSDQRHPELEENVYHRIKHALDIDANALVPAPAQVVQQKVVPPTVQTGMESILRFYKEGDQLKPALFRIGGGYDLFVDKRSTTVFLRTREEEGERKMLVLENAEFQLQLVDSDRTLLYVVIGLTYTLLLAAFIEMERKLPYPFWYIALK